MIIIGKNAVHKYLRFVACNASNYKNFNKQLVIGEFAGFFAGLLVAELAANLSLEAPLISILSAIADYSAAITGFFVIFYYDNKTAFIGLATPIMVKKIFGMTLRIWPSVIAADIVFLFVRPYVQLLLLSHNFDVAIGALFAHLVASGAFNLTAILSKSIFDFHGSSSYSYNHAESDG